MPTPTRQSLTDCRWTVRAVGDLSQVPASTRGRVIPATVPGCIHTDLMDAGLIPDPAVGMNEKEVQWVSWTDWRYECEFDADPALLPHHEIDLNFECLDTIATIELNGFEIGKAASEFIPWRFGVQGILKPGRNTLAVMFTSPLRHVHEMAAKLGRRPHNGDEQGWAPFNMIRKCASNFGWDWGPRVATCGMTGDLFLEAWSVVRVANVSFCVDDRANSSRDLTVRADLAWSQRGPTGAMVAYATIDAEDDPRARWHIDSDHDLVPSGVTAITRTLRRPESDGKFPVELLITDNYERGDQWIVEDVDMRVCSVGINRAKLSTSEDGTFLFEIDGQPTFIKGANWIPEGLWPRDRTPARCRERLRQALDANMSMIRVWGGGRYEPDWFYDLCDEMGIMVWQDFMFACACYPEEEPLRSLIECEARYQVSRLSRHPCVVLWCGGNECHWAYESWGFKERLAASDSPKTWGEHYWREMLPNIVAELSPGTPHWPDSPWSGDASKPSNSADAGDRHTWDVWGDAYRTIVPRFCSEFGQQAPSNWRTLEEAGLLQSRLRKEAGEAPVAPVAPGTQGPPPSGGGSDKQADDPARASDLPLSPALAARQLGPGGHARWYDEPMREWFKEPRDLDEWHAMAQLLQARSLRTAIEWMRANRPRCMGALVWQLNDAWPGLSWSLIDSAGRPKLAYEAVKHAFAPRLLTIQPIDGRLALCVVNDLAEPARYFAKIRRMTLDGATLAEADNVELRAGPASVSRETDVEALVGKPGDIRREFIVADAASHRATWFYAPDRELEHRDPAWTFQRVGNTTRELAFEVQSSGVVRDPWIDPRLRPEGAYYRPLRTLLPGERMFVQHVRPLHMGPMPPDFDAAPFCDPSMILSATGLNSR